MLTPIADIQAWHKRRETLRLIQLETHRLETYSRVKELLGNFHEQNPQTGVYLFGSILKKGKFNAQSDIDIALEKAHTDRLQLYAQWTNQLKRDIDIVMLEKCDFAEVIRKQGEKIY